MEKILIEIPSNAHEDEIVLKRLRTSLIALAIICNRHLKLLNASSMSRIVALATLAISVKSFETRALALRLVRVLCEKMPNYCLSQYKVFLFLNFSNFYIFFRSCYFHRYFLLNQQS